MGISFLRPFLQSLCCNSPWNYAVFWKLKNQDEMVLAWEDGFCDTLKPRDPMVSPIEDFYLENSNKRLSSTFSSSMLDGTPGEYPVGLAVAEMSSVSHVVGKGVVGKAAFTGSACWIYSDNIATDVLNSFLVPEYPDEWLLQFAAGIKTILLLPVIPHGVVQLGSVELVPEDAALVAFVTDKFEAHKKPNAHDWRYSIQQFSLMSTFMENLEEPSIINMKKVIEDQNPIHDVRTKDCNLITDQMMPVTMVKDFCHTSMKRVPDTLENATESDFSQQPFSMIHVAEPCQLSSEDYKSFITDNDVLEFFHHEEKLRASSYCDNFDGRMYGDFMNELMDFHFEEGATEQAILGNEFDNAICESGSNFFSFPEDCELHEALGTAAKDRTYQYAYGTSISGLNVACPPVGDREPSHSMDVSAVESVGFHQKEVEMEHLLEAVVANASSSFEDNSSNKSNVTSSDMSLGKQLASSKRHDQYQRSVAAEQDKNPWNFLTSGFISQGINVASDLSASVSSVESKISALSDNQQKRKRYDSVKPGKLSRLSTANKRRVPTGDNQRPRPRDRQLIQDRIKELRELVPNSENCSIDGLLDKTIKHMLFLRNVTDKADKLRHQVFEKADEKTARKAEINYSHQNGTSWAVELGSEQQLCPIIVKDLDHAGHMLIEMLCADHGRFLEIADVIHRLQLTILKGVLEKSTDNSWARYIVETSGSFHRLDIFWPLMQLLQQNRAPISSKI